MATGDFNVPDELIKQLNTLGSESADVAKEMVEAGGTVMQKAIKNKVPVKTGGTKRAIKKSGGHSDQNGVWYDNVYFDGYDGKAVKGSPKGTPYALKAMAAEYGTPTQPARPFLRPAMKAAESEAYKAMQDVYDRRSKK